MMGVRLSDSEEITRLVEKRNPQLENGFTRISNELMEAMCRINFSAYETRVLFALWRKTFGWQKTRDSISVSQFQKLTGLDRRHLARTLRKLEKRKIIAIASTGNRSPNIYKFLKDYSIWKNVAPKSNIANSGNTLLPVEATKVLPMEAPTKETITKEAITKEIYVTCFEKFWSVIPERHGKKKDKALCYAQYCKIKESDLEAVNQAAHNFSQSQDVQDGIGIPDPIRFLIKGDGNNKTEPWRDWLTLDKPQEKEGDYLERWKKQSLPT